MTATMTKEEIAKADADARRAELESQANAELEAHARRRTGYLELISKQFSVVNGTDRLENAIQLGKTLSNALNDERSIPTKKKLLEEFAKQVCGAYSDDKKLKPYIVLHHVSLRIPSLKTIGFGLSWALKVVGAMGAQLDWKSITDTMTALQIERANVILPLLIDGVDGIGCNSEGKADRVAWCKIIKYYLDHGAVPVAEMTATLPADKPTPVAPAVPAVPAVTTIEAVATILNDSATDLNSLCDMLSQETMDNLFDALASATTRKQEAMKATA